MATTATATATAKHLPLTDELRQKTKGLHGKTDRLVSLGLFAVLDYQACILSLSLTHTHTHVHTPSFSNFFFFGVQAQTRLHPTLTITHKINALPPSYPYQIYRQILLGFYYVFKTFEEEYDRHLKISTIDSQKQKWPAHPWVEHTYSPELRRTEAFEADLAYFYGPDWKDQVQPSKQVQEYMVNKHEGCVLLIALLFY
jgi:hypothetical protein